MDHPEATPVAAVITGAARGMGLAISRRLAQAGHPVVLLDVLATEVEAAADTLRAEGREATALPVDLMDETALCALPERMGPLFQRTGILVNNAAISLKRNGRRPMAAEIELEQWNAVLRVNLTVPFRLTQLFLPPMLARRWGRVINISSRAGRSPGGGAAADYVASKSGLLGLTRAFGKEVGASGITVNAVAPGPIETTMSRSSPPEHLASVLSNTPVGRFGTPDEVAALVAFVASPDAGFITGATIDINGGILMI